MNIDISGDNRVGITHDVLSCLARHQLDLAAMEVITGHIYMRVPELTDQNQREVFDELLRVEGVHQIARIDLLPDERRRMHLDALMSTLPEPVFAIDGSGAILSANSAATRPLGIDEKEVIGLPIGELIKSSGGVPIEPYHLIDDTEVMLAGKPYLMDLKPIYQGGVGQEGCSNSAGQLDQMLVLQAPMRIGSQISRVQMGEVKGFDVIAGESSLLKSVKERAQRFAGIHAPLLIEGETGTGKELFARAVHQVGGWSESAFLALNCAALPESLVESELFGYAPGAFSGASRSGKPGLLELADGGTAFLDEIGEMSLYVQAKLLRFIQDGTFRRVGGKDERKVNVRIICATHRNLEQLVKEGLFREDLMYRLNVLSLLLPPLRERASDIPLLAELFVARANEQIGGSKVELSTSAKDALCSYVWPGNVRQLENVLFRAVALTPEGKVTAEVLEQSGFNVQDIPEYEPESWKQAQMNFEKELLEKMYQNYPSTRKLAQRLGVSHTTIADKLRAYKIR